MTQPKPIHTHELETTDSRNLYAAKTEPQETETQPQNIDVLDLMPDRPIPIETIIEYRAKKLTYKEIGKLTGCTKQNIHQRLQPIINQLNSHDNYKKNRAEVLSLATQKGINGYLSLTDEETKDLVKKRGLVDFGIAYDKMCLEMGKSTSIIAFADYTKKIEEVDREIEVLEAEVGM